MKILLLGKTGQIGRELYSLLSATKKFQIQSLDRKEFDLKDYLKFKKVILKYKPDIFINAAAYTDVEKAEKEKDLCKLINADSLRYISKICYENKVILIHYSTDYVFDGQKSEKYNENDIPRPINFYGKCKLIGEDNVRSQNSMHIIIRTSWVYSQFNKNFLKTIIKLIDNKKKIAIINDQYGTPTSARFIAEMTRLFIGKLDNNTNIFGTYHVVPNGKTSWYEFSRKILGYIKSIDSKILFNINDIKSIKSEDYTSSALRPKNSVMSNSKFKSLLLTEVHDWDYYIKSVISSLFNKKHD